MSEQAVPFYEMFDCCKDNEDLAGILQQAQVISAIIDRTELTMRINIRFAAPVPPVFLSMIENEISEEFELKSVKIFQFSKNLGKKKEVKKSKNKILMGTSIKGKPVSIKDVNLESGRVIICGEVFGCEKKELQKQHAVILDFNITDHTSSIHISKFFAAEEDSSFVDEIKNGMNLTIQGQVNYNRWIGDICITPYKIEQSEKHMRQDEAAEKRVELHMHTRFSSLDALTDPKEAVETAARWGHKAVAITDHGIVQAFPDAWNASKKCGIKILYGTEGYFINDVDDRVVVHGDKDSSLDDTFVAFDLETTGLSSERDAITEIGAVVFQNGKIGERFQTFVDPERHIPSEITKLTGIKDEDVKGAPKLKQALEDFLKFAGDRPLCAHNADFDIGFISEGCRKCGLDFNPTSVDSLILSQNLLPQLKKHTLDSTANYLNLPEFNHHRASDDAITVAYILEKFFDTLRGRGITKISQINASMEELRGKGNVRRSPKHIILFAKNQVGLKNLYKLVSLAHLEHFSRYPIIPKSVLNKHREGIIVGSACESGELFSAVVARRSHQELKRIASYYDFLEIQPLCNNEFMLAAGKARNEEELKDFNRKIVQLGEELQKPVVATGDVHFLNPEDEIFRHILLSNKFSDADKPLPIYFKTTDEMLKEFSYLGEEKAYEVVVKNTNLIADWCDNVEPLPKGLFTPTIEGSVEQLKSLVYGKMEELYGDNPPDIVKTRVETELNDIINCHYDVIYMSAQKLVAKSLQAGYLVGSRGSVGSSIVAFLSGITEVNSLPPHYRCPKCKHTEFEVGDEYGCGCDMPDKICPVCGEKYAKDGFDIPFETFLGFGGDKVPDIDLNFSGEYQANAHKDTIELFGKDHVFRAGTIGTIAEKTAYGYVKKYLEERGLTVSKAEETRLAHGIVGVKRTTGQHPGGLVVIPQTKEVTDFCPVQHPADDADSDIITTHFEYHSMESNLLKLDLLGHDDPSMIRMLQDLSGVDPKSIPLDDPDTMSIFRSPKALGLPDDDPIIGKTGSIAVPEFGTKFTREMLVDTQPRGFATLVRLSGFSHGTDVWLGNAKDLILSGTATVDQAIGCRDDIMLYLISNGMDERLAFKIMESVRKGRGLQEEWEKEMRKINVPEWYIDSCKKIKYLFPKAHAVAYVTMAVRIAWYKVHCPLAFYSAYFTIRAVAFDAEIMINGIDRVRQKMKEIESNTAATAVEKDMMTTLEVCYEFYMRGFSFAEIDIYRSDSVKFLIDGDKLIPPFTALAGLGESAAQDIVQHRRDKDFVSIEEFAASCPKVSKTHIELLNQMGAFGDLPETSQISLF